MALNIKNEETHQLVRELAELTGESMTEAVTEAVRERLEKVRREKESRFERLMAIAKETAPLLRDLPPSTAIGDLLYDERGLPR